MEVLQPGGWPRPVGYANGMAAQGRVVFVAGQVGWDPGTETMVAADIAGQTARALDNVLAVLRAADAAPVHVARMTWYITDLEAYRAARREIGRIWRERFGTHFPAMSVVGVAALLEPGALVEIEATAVIP